MITHKRDGSGQCTNAVQKIDKLIKINTKLQQQTESMQSQSQSTQRESMQWVFCTFWCCFALSLSLIYRPNCVIIVQIFSPSGAPYNKTYPHNTTKQCNNNNIKITANDHFLHVATKEVSTDLNHLGMVKWCYTACRPQSQPKEHSP
eukprot:1115685_1